MLYGIQFDVCTLAFGSAVYLLATRLHCAWRRKKSKKAEKKEKKSYLYGCVYVALYSMLDYWGYF